MRGRRALLAGQRFGRLLVTHDLPIVGANRNARALVTCDCGAVKEVMAMSLKAGSTKSCGCLLREVASEGHTRRKRAAWERMKEAVNTSPERLRSALAAHMDREDWSND